MTQQTSHFFRFLQFSILVTLTAFTQTAHSAEKQNDFHEIIATPEILENLKKGGMFFTCAMATPTTHVLTKRLKSI